jgi:hypothetical protein
MAKLKGKMTRDEHKELGRELATYQRRLTSLVVNLSNRYGSSKRLTRRATAVNNQLARLRCELDDQLAQDYPAEFDQNVYYPGAD